MPKKKTEINPLRAKNVKKLITEENVTQKVFAKRTGYTQQNISKIICQKTALTEEAARDIIKAFPDYRIEWLLGYDDIMRKSDLLDAYLQKAQKNYDVIVSTVRTLAKRCGIDVQLYAQETGTDDVFIVRHDDAEAYVTYPELTELVEDLTALAQSQLNRIIRKGSH